MKGGGEEEVWLYFAHWHKIVRPVQGVWGYTNKGSPVSNRYKGEKAQYGG